MIKGLYANVIVDISHEKVDRPFQYRIPEMLQGKLEPGMRVRIPFGSGNRLRTGYVIEVTDEAEWEIQRLKEIDSLLEEEAPAEADRIRLAAWMRAHYGSTMIQALKTVLPARQKAAQKEKKEIRRLVSCEEAASLAAVCEEKHQPAKARVLRELSREEILPYELVSRKLNVASPTLKSLEKAGVIAVSAIPCYRNPVKLQAEREAGRELGREQRQAAEGILAEYDSGIRRTYLLYGITGSGKTEVYLRLIEEIVARGKQAIVLIPEIALTYQTVLRFYKRFGDRVSVMNSTLSYGEKYDQCERARKGEIDVIIGPRSALFTPFPNLGMIILDEEHESSYKSETMPKYHARETAEQLAAMHGASVVLGSATPSMEAYYRVKQGKYGCFRLTERLTGGCLPKVEVADLREELKTGNRSIFSRRLAELMEDRLQHREQIMLFLNRRGYAGFISCRMCGLVMKCPHCDVSLSEHRNGQLVCHYCGYTRQKPPVCPDCGSKYLLGFKAGTQQVEEEIRKRYPQARVLRMDADTTRTKDSYEKILSAFLEQEADILVGTQMIVKGHDFPNVTLVGVLAADLSLSVGDYRASERTFQLLTQAAGRAGRGKRPGEVVIQTYQPEHYSIRHAAAQDYESFYEEEILYREMLAYPPVSHILAVQVGGASKEGVAFLAEKLARLVRDTEEKAEEPKVQIIGPAPASIGKINDLYRYGVYLKHMDYERLVQCRDQMEAILKQQENRKESVQFDFDPVNPY